MNSKYLAQYLEDGHWKTISCYRYKRLCSQEPTKWEHLDLKSKPIQGVRYNVHTRSTSSKFCFSGTGPKTISRNRMTTTHEYITEVISNLDRLKLKVNDYSLTIIPDSVVHEKERIKLYCTEKKEVVEYIPDLLIRFSNSPKLVKDWGGQIAIEVNVTHSPDDTKRRHFQFLGIPLLEIDASKKLKFSKEGEDASENLLKSYKDYLESTLSQQIESTIEYPTYSNRSLGNKVYNLQKENEELHLKIKGLVKSTEQLIAKSKKNELDFIDTEKELNREIQNKQQQLDRIEKELTLFKNRSFVKKVIDLFN